MNINHLKYFKISADTMSMSEAARTLRVSQPAVSRAIQALEDELGVRLFLHKKRQLQLTEAGQYAAKMCDRVFDSLDEFVDSVQGFQSELRGPLRLGCSDSVAATILQPALVDFREEHPRVDTAILFGGSDQTKQAVLSKLVDVGIVVRQGDLSAFEVMPLVSSRFCLVRSGEAKFSGPGDKLILARTDQLSFSSRFLRDYKHHYGKGAVPFLVLPSWLVCKSYVLMGLGQSILPEFVVQQELESGMLKKVRCKIPMEEIELCAITKKGRSVPLNGRPLLEMIGR